MEVTELGVVGRHAAETLHVLHNEGIRIALDDFGAGFASFSALSELPLDILKIDQSLTWGRQRSGSCWRPCLHGHGVHRRHRSEARA